MILEALDRRGMRDNTYIIFASDHGEMLGDHGLYTKSLPYEASVRVPLIAAGPGIRGGCTSDALVELIDVNPTICALAGLAVAFGLGEAFVTTSTGALVADLTKRESLGAAMGTFGTIADTGQAAGPIIVGALLAWIGYLPAFSLLSGFLILWTGMFLRVRTSP
jgi:hypothetical protein